MDFVHDELSDGRKIRCLTFVDKLSRAFLKVSINYHLNSGDVVDALNEVMVGRGIAEIICVDNGSEFTSFVPEDPLEMGI